MKRRAFIALFAALPVAALPLTAAAHHEQGHKRKTERKVPPEEQKKAREAFTLSKHGDNLKLQGAFVYSDDGTPIGYLKFE